MTENLTMVFETYEEAADEAQWLAWVSRLGYQGSAVMLGHFVDGFVVAPFGGIDMTDPDNADRVIHVYYPEEG